MSQETKEFWNTYSLASLFRSHETERDRDEWGRNLIARLERAVEAEATPGEHMAHVVDRLGLRVALVRADQDEVTPDAT
jgi:hypothetical protein